MPKYTLHRTITLEIYLPEGDPRLENPPDQSLAETLRDDLAEALSPHSANALGFAIEEMDASPVRRPSLVFGPTRPLYCLYATLRVKVYAQDGQQADLDGKVAAAQADMEAALAVRSKGGKVAFGLDTDPASQGTEDGRARVDFLIA